MRARANSRISIAWIVISAGLFLANPVLAQPVQAAPDKAPFHPTRILVKFKEGEQKNAQLPVLRQHGLKIRRQFKSQALQRLAVLDLDNDAEVKAAKALAPGARTRRLQERITALRATKKFEYVEPDYIRTLNAEPTDAAFTDGTLWALRNTGQNGGISGADIGAVAAWDITTGSSDVVVAVIDTGIRYTHQDLAANMWRNPGESGGGKEANGIDDDGDNYIDNVFGINAVTGTGNPMDDHGHGSHVAGTIGAAANNGNPHVGVAWNVRLMACKALDAEGGGDAWKTYVSDTVTCIDFAVAKGARVINASYGSPAYSQTEFDTIRAARDQGVLFVAAAGNSRSGEDNDSSWLRSYPASHALENVIAVAALDRSDNLAGFSHFGRGSVHLGAPGVDIFSCVNGSDSAYATFQGTSMAAPHVVGVAALILADRPSTSLVELRRRILKGTVQVPSLTDKTATGGRLNAFNSLMAAPTGSLNVEVFPRSGQALSAGKTVTLAVIVSDLMPVANASVTASISGIANLPMHDDGIAPDSAAGDGIYTSSFQVPSNVPSLEVSLAVSAAGWQSVASQVYYPVVLPPANDNFSDRIAITPGLCPTTVTASNGNASREPGEPYHGSELGGRSVWWSWTAPFTGPVKISTAGSWVITSLAVYTGTAFSNLDQVAANDHPSADDWYSVVTFDAVAGTEYQIAVDGIGPDAGSIVLGVMPLISSGTLADALDDPDLVWTTGGDAPWFGQSCVTHDGSDSARSSAVEANGVTWLETTVRGPGFFSFWWKVSSEAGWDHLRFQLDGLEQKAITGEVDWQQDRRWLEVGDHILRWTYTKDFIDIDPKGQDAGWVDEGAFEHVAPAIPSMFGDLDRDGSATVLDLALLTGYLQDSNSLLPQIAVFGDVNGDTLINGEDIPALAEAILGRNALMTVLDDDADGIPDVLEALLGFDPTKPDSNFDGTPDGSEDSDYDGLTNAAEIQLGTDPLRRDADSDGWPDEAEITAGSNPLDANSNPYMMVTASPPAAVMLPANEGPGGLATNTVVATPPASLVLPANEGSGGLTPNTVLAAPPVSLVLPGDEGSGGLAPNTTVATPPVSLMLPANEGTSGLLPNTTVATPPVRIELDSP